MVRNLTLDARFCLIGRSEVNSIRYSPPNKPINVHEKHYSIVSYIPRKIKKKKNWWQRSLEIPAAKKISVSFQSRNVLQKSNNILNSFPSLITTIDKYKLKLITAHHVLRFNKVT